MLQLQVSRAEFDEEARFLREHNVAYRDCNYRAERVALPGTSRETEQ